MSANVWGTWLGASADGWIELERGTGARKRIYKTKLVDVKKRASKKAQEWSATSTHCKVGAVRGKMEQNLGSIRLSELLKTYRPRNS